MYPNRLKSCPLHFCFLAGLISPWNLPLYLLTWKIAPAIACGNTVVAKPSEMTSVTAWMMCKLLEKAGKGRECDGTPCLCTIFVAKMSAQRIWERLFAVAECCTGERKALPCPHTILSPQPRYSACFFHYLLMKILLVSPPFPLLPSP